MDPPVVGSAFFEVRPPGDLNVKNSRDTASRTGNGEKKTTSLKTQRENLPSSSKAPGGAPFASTRERRPENCQKGGGRCQPRNH